MPTLRVHQIRFHHESLFELELERGEMTFEPGAGVALFNDAADSRPYSIAADSGEEHLRFLIRRIPNGRNQRLAGSPWRRLYPNPSGDLLL